VTGFADVRTSLIQCTRNLVLLSNMPLGIVTSTCPEVAPAGTVALINVDIEMGLQ